MWITNETSHSIYLAVKTTVNIGTSSSATPNPTRLIPRLNLRETQLWSGDELQDLRVQIVEVGRFTLSTLSGSHLKRKHIFQLLFFKCHES